MATPGDELAAAVAASGASIYDDPNLRPDLRFPIDTLELRLDALLHGTSLAYPLRTRSKIAKALVAEALGYAAPTSFRKTRPRFPAQNLDLFVQKADNLQIWNEQVDPGRRYALARVDAMDRVVAVRVLSGEALALMDRTGTLTTKYQAARRGNKTGSVLVSPRDTDGFVAAFRPVDHLGPGSTSLSPTARPKPGQVLAIASVFERLRQLRGVTFEDTGRLRDRNRGVELQRLVCQSLNLGRYADAGQFPDVLCQALEVKLQLSPTVDLGLVSPDSTADAPEVGHSVRHCDCRYAVFYASRTNHSVIQINDVVMSTGADFFVEFRRFEGLVRNSKIQLRLPKELFEAKRDLD